MGWLVFETLLLMLAFVAFGIGVGIALRTLAEDAGRRPSMAGARFAPIDPGAPAPVHAPHAPAAHEPARPAPMPSPDPELVLPDPEPEPVAAPEPAPQDAVIDPDKAAAADQVGTRPAALARPRDDRPDDLKVIKGIGPQNEARLNALGIYHLDQIAGWSAEEARWIGSYLAFPGRIEREDWVGQARGLGRRQ